MFKRTATATLAAALGFALTASGTAQDFGSQAEKTLPKAPGLGQYEKDMPRVAPSTGGPLGKEIDKGFPGEEPGLEDLSKAAKAKEHKDDGCRFIGDVNRDGLFDFNDLVALLSQWGECGGCTGDLNEDGWVDVLDLVRLLSYYPPLVEPEPEVKVDFWHVAPKARPTEKQPPAGELGD